MFLLSHICGSHDVQYTGSTVVLDVLDCLCALQALFQAAQHLISSFHPMFPSLILTTLLCGAPHFFVETLT